MTQDAFLGADGKPDSDKSRNSALGIGVPGTVAGLALVFVASAIRNTRTLYRAEPLP